MSAETLALADELAAKHGLTRPQVLRKALKSMAKRDLYAGGESNIPTSRKVFQAGVRGKLK